MSKIDEMLNEYASLAGNADPASGQRKSEIIEWLKENDCPELREKGHVFLTENIQRIEKDINNLKKEYAEEYKLLPISYIARKYFGKSAAWLQQRLNGYRVRGKLYELDEEQKKLFNSAVQDIAKKIGSVHVS